MAGWKRVSLMSLGDFHLVGEGSFGTIYRSRHKEWNIDVAVKKINGFLSLGEASQALEDLISEAKMMDVASRSPHVISLYGMLEDILNGQQCRGIVMEYMERGSLYSLLEKVRSIPWALKFRMLHQVALGMNWLHSLSPPLLHLDLKTKNILLNPDLHVKAANLRLGLSKFIRNNSMSVPCSEEVGGTLEYMPPEAFQLEYTPSKSTDVYSFAILSATVITEDDPYPVLNSALIRIRVAQGDRPSLKSLKEISSVRCLNEAISIIERCWHQNKSERPLFGECSCQWEKIYSAHQNDIINAVRQVQDKMMEASAVNSPTQSTGTAYSSNVSWGNRRSHALNITYEPSVMQMAAPPSYKLKHASSQDTQPARMPHPQAGTQTRPKPFDQGFNTTAPKEGYAPGYSYQQNPTSYYTPKPYVHNPLLHQPTSTITILNSTGGVQVGNNNVMTVMGGNEGSSNSSSNMRLRNTVYSPMGAAWSNQTVYPPFWGQWPNQHFFQSPWSTRPLHNLQGQANRPMKDYTQRPTQTGFQPLKDIYAQGNKQRSSQFVQSNEQYNTPSDVQQNQDRYSPKPGQ